MNFQNAKMFRIMAISITILFLGLMSTSITHAADNSNVNVITTNYQYQEWGQYQLVMLDNERYVPLSENQVDKVAKLVIDSNDKHSLKTGDKLDLGSGYSLTAKQVDVDGKKVWLEFDKDGQYIDEKVVSTDTGQDHSWECTIDTQGETDVPVLKVHVVNVYQGAVDSIALIDGLWLIDYANAQSSNTNGVNSNTNSGSITETNTPQDTSYTDSSSINSAGVSSKDSIADIIQPGTILKGTMDQFQGAPYANYTYSMIITVTDVVGTEFVGTLDYQSHDITDIGGKIRGTIDPTLNRIQFTPYESTASSNGYSLILNIPYNAELKDGVLNGYWSYSGGTMGGTFSISPTANPTLATTEQPQYTLTEQPQPTYTEQPQPTYTEQPQPTYTEQPQPTPTEQPPAASVNLHGEKTNVVMGEDIKLKLSAVNLITKPTMHTQVILIPPSGMSVSSSDFVESGAGQYTATFDLEPGKGKDIEVKIAANQVGDFDVQGTVVYYFGSNKKEATYQDLDLPIHVSDNNTSPTHISTPSSYHSLITISTPGFGTISLVFMIIVVFLLRRK